MEYGLFWQQGSLSPLISLEWNVKGKKKMYEMSHCVSLFSRCYFEIFMGGDVFAGDSFHLETFRIPMKGFFFPLQYTYSFLYF